MISCRIIWSFPYRYQGTRRTTWEIAKFNHFQCTVKYRSYYVSTSLLVVPSPPYELIDSCSFSSSLACFSLLCCEDVTKTIVVSRPTIHINQLTPPTQSGYKIEDLVAYI